MMGNELQRILEHLAEIQEGLGALIFLLKEVEVNFDLSNSKSVEAILDITTRNMTSLHLDMQQQLQRMDEVLLNT